MTPTDPPTPTADTAHPPRARRAGVIASTEASASPHALPTPPAPHLHGLLAQRYDVRRVAVNVRSVHMELVEYRERDGARQVAFTASVRRLITRHARMSVVRSMVDLAQARQWPGLRVSGQEAFKRLVWLEAGARGVPTQGYVASADDLACLQRLRLQRQTNHIVPDAAATMPPATRHPRGSLIQAIEAVLLARRVPAPRRERILTVAREQLSRCHARAQPTERPEPALQAAATADLDPCASDDGSAVPPGRSSDPP